MALDDEGSRPIRRLTSEGCKSSRRQVYGSAHSARQGFDSETRDTVASSGIDAGDLLLSAVSEVGAELLVMGACGHRRLREILLGGATRAVLREMTVPVVMSH